MQLKYNFSEVSHVGNVRDNNEDSSKALKTNNGDLFIVCDGMGGAAEGKKASSLAVDSIVAYFTKEKYDNLQIALYKSLEFANEQIYATAQAYPNFKGMGTTACVILLQDNQFHFAHVGDSRIYLFSNNNLYQLTKDHSFVNQLVDQGTITIEAAKTHKDKNRILRALGVHAKVEPTISSQPMLLKKNDVLLSCSDGLTDMVSDETIKEILSTDLSVELKTKNLVEKALANGGKDNVTVQTIEITESPNNKTTFIDKTIYPKKDLSKTMEEEIKVTKKSFPIKKIAILLVSLILLAVLMIVLFGKNKKKEIPNETVKIIEKVEKQSNKKDKIVAKSSKLNTNYFIIGKENNVSKNIFKNITQYKKETKDSISVQKIEKINGKKANQLKIGDTIFLTNKKLK